MAETYAVINRIARDKSVDDVSLKSMLDTLSSGPWRYINILPIRRDIAKLSAKWPLRGADLWHLSLAVLLKRYFPELCMFTFDMRLHAAARGENLTK
jgi:hypothetical protein